MPDLDPEMYMFEVSEMLLAASQRWFPQIYNRPPFDQLIHMVLGVTGEAGELANVVKKINRNRNETTEEMVEWLLTETADVMVYCLLIFALYDVDPMQIIAAKHQQNELRFGDTTGP